MGGLHSAASAKAKAKNMMLATSCPYCHTTFRVVQDQLKICNGIVRCGSCRQVFNGIEQLQSADAVLPTEHSRAENLSSWPESAEANPNPFTIVARVDEKAAFTEAYDDLNLILTPAEESHEQSHTSLSDTPDPVDYVMEAASEAQAIKEEPSFVAEPSAINEEVDLTFALRPLPAEELPVEVAQLEPDDDDPAYKVEIRSQTPEPAFVQRARQKERFNRMSRIAMVILILAMLPALAFQSVDAFHQRIEAAFPQTKPVLSQVCEIIDCQTDLPAQIDAVSVDASELQAPTVKEPAFTLNVLLRNRSLLAQAWPYVELTLKDSNEKPVVRRVFTATEYLPASQDASLGFTANSEHSVKLVFEVDQQLKPVGYRVYLFYP